MTANARRNEQTLTAGGAGVRVCSACRSTGRPTHRPESRLEGSEDVNMTRAQFFGNGDQTFGCTDPGRVPFGSRAIPREG
jgi:hypothetical protein